MIRPACGFPDAARARSERRRAGGSSARAARPGATTTRARGYHGIRFFRERRCYQNTSCSGYHGTVHALKTRTSSFAGSFPTFSRAEPRATARRAAAVSSLRGSRRTEYGEYLVPFRSRRIGIARPGDASNATFRGLNGLCVLANTLRLSKHPKNRCFAERGGGFLKLTPRHPPPPPRHPFPPRALPSWPSWERAHPRRRWRRRPLSPRSRRRPAP